MDFKLISPLRPKGDQPQAIEKLVEGVRQNKRYQTLLGVTGSGKTFTIGQVIAQVQKPTLVVSHNKTLAAQLYSEFRELFPHNAVEYFVSYYDYYQPEAYVPQTDTYIEKDASINENLDRLRLKATSSLLGRRDCIIVSSVSCIYNIGSPADYAELLVCLKKGEKINRDDLLRELVDIQYQRNDYESKRGTFRVRGDVVEVFLAYEEVITRIEFEGDRVTRLSQIDSVTKLERSELDSLAIYPAKHFVTTEERLDDALETIEKELEEHLKVLASQNKLLEAQRLEQRTRYDIEMMREMGFCSGIENYSRHLSGRKPGERPYCLLDYFPKDFLVVIDESHVTVPQIRGMYFGDRSRKGTLVEHGFRLPSALDNRPLQFEEFEALISQEIFVSATPSEFEVAHSRGVVEQIIRPTGLLDPEVEIRPTRGQIDDLMDEIQRRAKKKERTLVTTLTKRMAEDLAQHLKERGVRVRYLHSDIDTIERVEILRDLRRGQFDCLVGINLLREGLDLPEVSLVAVLDADKEGFLRSETSLIQTAGRASRNKNGKVILYADQVTDSMRRTANIMKQRRQIQQEYNKLHGITPKTIQKGIREGIEAIKRAKGIVEEAAGFEPDKEEVYEALAQLELEMEASARNLQFERAIVLRDQILSLKKNLGQGEMVKKGSK